VRYRIVFSGKPNDVIVPVLPCIEVVMLHQAHSLLVFINLRSSWKMRETKNSVGYVSQVEHLMSTTGQVVLFTRSLIGMDYRNLYCLKTFTLTTLNICVYFSQTRALAKTLAFGLNYFIFTKCKFNQARKHPE